MSDDRDDSLTWVGDSDPTHVDTPATRPHRADAAETSTERVDVAATATRAGRVTSSALLVTYGILAGVYLIYTIGWVVTVQRNPTPLPDVLAQFMFQLGQYLAIAAPAAWFGTVLLLTRGGKPIARLLWLLAGAIVLVPLPFTMGV